MENSSMKEFLMRNGLKQIDIARYLDLSKETVSRYVRGTLNVPVTTLHKLVNNPYGWNTQMLTKLYPTSITATASGNGKSSITIDSNNNCNTGNDKILIDSLQKEIESLRQQLAEEKKRSDEYWKMIQTLMNK